ncbi:MAG: hypothetical protein JNJ56_11760 [Ignavibacteria bacterium]|nr:hypothetical protein [Ignavibacteria bacterium]
MKKEKNTLVNQIHRYFGCEFNNSLWDYFDKKDRTDEENDDMIGIAFSALTHWKIYSGGTAANVQRGEYMIAKAFYKAGNRKESMIHAEKCLKISEEFKSEMKDFDFAFANEIMALAHDLNGNKSGFEKFKEIARKKGEEIQEEGDRRVYFVEFKKSFGES